ncbi:MAG: HAD family phosphatase [Firmicutes bacterium]|nr:HAD family phosphatase [Bacillota bacterium]
MIRSLVFDIGMVLAEFRWKSLMEELGFSPETIRRVSQATVLGPWWNEFDRSLLSDEEIIRHCVSLAPECEPQIRLFFDSVGHSCREYPYAYDWLRKYHDEGYGIYLLSNYSRKSFLATDPPYRFLSLVDGGIISYQVRMIKPEPGIFRALFERFDLQPSACILVDDNPANIAAAETVGMHTVLHSTYEQSDAEIRRLLGIHNDYTNCG